ncbi:MAG: DUF4493 domain-containing protein [Rikenellaceae bacterium]
MKRSLVALMMVVALVGCTRSDIEQSSEGEGALALSITRSEVSGDDQSLWGDDVTLRIYNSNDRLVARYSGSEIPQALYLAAGSYKATVSIGSEVAMSSSSESIFYYGEQSFAITGGAVNNLDVNCTIQNTVVAVVFDQSVYDRFELETSSYLYIADEFVLADVVSGGVESLKFSGDGKGYFILPEGSENIAWGFYGESASVDPTTAVASTTAEFGGVISNPMSATMYTLNFKYTQTPDGSMGLTVTIDESVDEFNDLFSFSPQPTITGQDFEMDAEGLIYTGDDVVLSISSITDISDIQISSADFTGGVVTIMEDGVIGEYPGVAYTATDASSGKLSLGEEFFEYFATSGDKVIEIEVCDVVDSKGSNEFSIAVSGTATPTLDAWSNSAVFAANVYLSDVSDVKLAYRLSGSDLWEELETTKGSGYSYTANVEPTWTSSKNTSSLTYYNVSGGVSAGSSYDYKLIIDGVDYPTNSVSLAAGHAITNGDMESSSIPAYSTSSSSSTNWASGNNGFSSDLCAQVSKGGSNCAYLKSRTAVGVFAAGNLNYGQFEMDGFSGDMRFGQALSWVSRPRAFKFRYAATIGAETHDSNNMLDGMDKARVYFAVVDWSGRHTVTAGTSGSPSGAWDPETQTSTSEGAVIGYASIYFTESTSGDDLYEVEIPINYYDKVTKPSGSISIVLSCAASAYGDYMTGSTDSRLWLDDFELVY